AAEHPVGDRERDRPQLVEQSLTRGHAAVNPCRQLRCAGRHASSRLAFAFEAPRSSVIIITPVSPANSRPTNRGTRIGFLAPSVCASAGNHSATGAGASSTTFLTAALPCSPAAPRGSPSAGHHPAPGAGSSPPPL